MATRLHLQFTGIAISKSEHKGPIEYLFGLCDKVNIEDVSLQRILLKDLPIGYYRGVAADAFLYFDHPEDAAIFEQHYPEMIAGEAYYGYKTKDSI